MKVLRKFIAVAAAVLAFTACDKETPEIIIPDTLDQTMWSAGNGSYARTAVFDSETCVITTADPNQTEEPTVETFSYTYEKPALVLTDTADARNVWSGKVLTDGKTYLIISLSRPDDPETSLELWSPDYSSFWRD